MTPVTAATCGLSSLPRTGKLSFPLHLPVCLPAWAAKLEASWKGS